MPFVRPEQEPPKRTGERPVTDPEILLRWYRLDLERWAREDAEKARAVAEAELIVQEKGE